MDVQLKELIDRIKNDGVKTAEESAKNIIDDAEKKAKDIIANAEKKAAELKESSVQSAEVNKQSSENAIKQSARDLVIDLKKEVETIFDNFIKSETEKSLKGDGLSKAIITVLGNWKPDSLNDMSILLPESEVESVKNSLSKEFAAQMKSGLEIKPHKSVDAGFKISEKDGNVYYDFSVEGIGEMLAEYLSPQLANFVKEVKES